MLKNMTPLHSGLLLRMLCEFFVESGFNVLRLNLRK